VDPSTFLDDPLRALRVVQFVARLGFAPDEALVDLCRAAPLAELPAERVFGEWEKLLCRGVRFVLAFDVARRAAILERVFPEVAERDPGADLERVRAHRDRTSPEGRRLALMLVAWLYPAEPAGIEATLDRLGMHTLKGYRVRDRVLDACAALDAPAATDRDLRWLSTRAEAWLVLGVRGEDAALERCEALQIAYAPPPRLLAGRHLAALGVKGGPAMGRLLDAAWAAQLDGALTTEAEAVAWARDHLA
jgi:tRNA nucleotidyltransferase (CCA-adding enzyme)